MKIQGHKEAGNYFWFVSYELKQQKALAMPLTRLKSGNFLF